MVKRLHLRPASPSESVGYYVMLGENVVIGEGSVVQDGAIIEDNCTIGKNCRIGYHAVLRRGTIVGENSVFGSLSTSEGNNFVGRRTTIHTACHITSGVKIGDDVFIAPYFVGANTRRIRHGRNYPLKLDPYVIENGVRIGICVSVLPGVRIGREALVGAGSLVTRDVPPFSIIYGRPARVVGTVPSEERLEAR